MVWQDIIIATANLIFVISLIPQAILGFKRKRGFVTIATSLPTAIGIFAISFSFFTLSLWYSGVVSFFSGALWMIIFFQRIIYPKG